MSVAAHRHAPAVPDAQGGRARRLGTVALVTLAVVATAGALRAAQVVFIPIVLAMLLGYMLEPIVRRLERLRLPRPVGAAVAVLVLAVALAALGYALKDQALAILDELPTAADRLSQLAQSEPVKRVQQAAQQLQEAAGGAGGSGRTAAPAPPATGTLLGYVWWGSLGALGVAGEILMVLFLVYFVLAAGDLYKQKLVTIAGRGPARERVLDVLEEIRAQIARFLVVQLVTAVVVGVATWLALLAVGLERAAFWGAAAGVVNSIPYFGPIVVTGGLFVVGLLQFGTVPMALLVAGIALGITTLEGWTLAPVLLGRAVRMNHVAVFVALVVWGWIWGVWGVLLAVPMIVAIKAVCDRVEGLRPVGELLGE
jgi:predicted PurR-regulated permease PerM